MRPEIIKKIKTLLKKGEEPKDIAAEIAKSGHRVTEAIINAEIIKQKLEINPKKVNGIFLSPTQEKVLMALWYTEHLTAHQIAKEIEKLGTTVASSIRELNKDKLVKTQEYPHPTANRHSLTLRGKALGNQIKKKRI